MRYLLTIHEDETIYGADKDNSLLNQVVAQHGALAQSLGSQLIAGAGLRPATTATTVITRNGQQSLHDGPFAEAREQMGGFYLIDVPDLDAAIDWAARCPAAARSGVEVRPVLVMGGS